MRSIVHFCVVLCFGLLISIVIAPRQGQNPQIVRLLNTIDIKHAGRTKIVSVFESILDLLKDDGLVRFNQRLAPKSVGVHPSNRYGFGVSSAAVHRLGKKIVGMGWSWTACALAICIADSSARRIAKFTVRMQRGSNRFGCSDENEVLYGSLSNGHTNQFLVAVIDGAPTTEECLAVDGHISQEKVNQNDDKIVDAWTRGMSWTVLDSRCEELYGNALCNLAQRARQAVGQVQNEESNWQIIMEIQNMVGEAFERGEDPDFDAIEAVVDQSQIKNPEDIEHFVSWVRLYGGGRYGKYTHEVADFISLCVPADRTFEGKWLGSFCKLKLESTELCPDFVTAAIFAQLDCPPKKVISGVCRFIKDTHINALQGTKKASMIEASALCREFQNVVRGLDLPHDRFVAIVGKGKSIAARIVFELPVPEPYEDLTVNQMLHVVFEKDVKEDFQIQIDNPFDAKPVAEDSQEQAKAKSSMSVLEYSASGSALNADKQTLASQGFIKGADVTKGEGYYSTLLFRLSLHQIQI